MKKLLIIVFLLTPLVTFAQFKLGVGAGYLNAIGQFSDTHQGGYNVALQGEYEFLTVGLIGELGYNTFYAKDDLLIIDDVSGVSFTAGIGSYLTNTLYASMRFGYYGGDIGETALIFAPGLRFKKFDINFGVNFLAPTAFLNLKFSYFLIGK